MVDISQEASQASLVRAIVENSPNGIITIDEQGMIESFNPTAERLFGYSQAEVIGRNISLLMPEPHRSAHDSYIHRYQTTGIPRIICKPGRELTALGKGGRTFPIELMVAEMWIDDERHYLGFIHDIGERKQRDTQLHHILTHDQISGLMNRRKLVSLIDAAIAEDKTFLLFYLGLDRFQAINEVLGHNTGDQVLAKVGKRLASICEHHEEIAHIGGSAFALLYPNPEKGISALDMGQSIHSCLQQPLQLEQFDIDAEASIGIVRYPGHGCNAEDLLRHAQTAMQAARKQQIMFAVYDDEMESYQLEYLTLASELRHAIESNELVVYYQPKVDISDEHIVGVEALIRWQHSEKGMIQPDSFIPMAEETGIIHPFTAWLINEVCRQIRQWLDKGIDLVVAINLAPRNLLEADLPEQLHQAILHWNISPANLMMEITERGLIAEPKRAMITLDRIHNLGIQISIDDFGTGYSSLAYLKDLPLDELKIDKSFIDSMHDDPRSLTIVQMVIQMAHYLGFEVIAEGVESASEWRRLELLECDRAQGYYMGKPMPCDQLEVWMSESPWGAKAVVGEEKTQSETSKS